MGHTLEICKSHPFGALRDNRHTQRAFFKRCRKPCGAFANGLANVHNDSSHGALGICTLFNIPLQIYRAISMQRQKFAASL